MRVCNIFDLLNEDFVMLEGFHSFTMKPVHYLAQKLCFWTGIILIGVYVSVCLCVNVCLNYLKKFLADFDETWQGDL